MMSLQILSADLPGPGSLNFGLLHALGLDALCHVFAFIAITMTFAP